MFGTTVTRPVSMTPQVSVRAKRSPTCTAALSVFHQHWMGTDSMLGGPTADGNVVVAEAAGGDVMAAAMDAAAAGAVLDNAAPAIAASAIWGRAQE